MNNTVNVILSVMGGYLMGISLALTSGTATLTTGGLGVMIFVAVGYEALIEDLGNKR